MKKNITSIFVFTLISLLLTACNTIDNKTVNISLLYGITVIFSLILLIAYCTIVKKRDLWFILLYTSVLVVNIGYFALSVSKTLGEALLANRIAYLGSVFLPLFMLMIIMDLCKLKHNKIFFGILLIVGIIVFLIAASPGYLPIYYKSASIEYVNGITTLKKVYGSLHSVYLFYLIMHFVMMTVLIIYSSIVNRSVSHKLAIIIASMVFGNIIIWLTEQLIDVNFEFLSISYIITELFLLLLYSILEENHYFDMQSDAESSYTSETENESVQNNIEYEPDKDTHLDKDTHPDKSENNTADNKNDNSDILLENYEYFISNLSTLTPTENKIYDLYLSGKKTKEVLDILGIKENTLKYHNKNIYSKLGVSSRKQLLQYASMKKQ